MPRCLFRYRWDVEHPSPVAQPIAAVHGHSAVLIYLDSRIALLQVLGKNGPRGPLASGFRDLYNGYWFCLVFTVVW